MKRILLICCLFPLLSNSQEIRLFADTLQKLRAVTPVANIIHQGIYSYIPNTSTDGSTRSVSTMIKVDTSGNTVWTAFPANYVTAGTDASSMAVQKIALGSDSNIYAQFSGLKLGKIRAANGSVDWMVTLTPLIGTSRTDLLDYDTATVLFANATSSINKVRVIRYRKANGEHLGYKELNCPAPGIFGMYSSDGAIYIANADSVFKYTSYDNPVLEWKVKICTGTDRFLDIHKLSREGNNLFVFGNKESGFHNGMVSCIDLVTGTLKWFVKNGDYFDLLYADHKIKNGFLYTSWKHMYVGSISERCFINRIDINSGTKSWEFNHAFRTQYVNVSKAEAMLSIEIDDNETLFLSGYGLPDNQTGSATAFMKIRGSNGTVLQRNFLPGSSINRDYPTGITNHFVNGKLFTTGLLPTNIAGAYLDTADLSTLKVTPYRSSIQYPSSVIGIRNLSASKKVILYKQGKSLKLQVADAEMNKLWEKTIGDTLYPYEGLDFIGVNEVTKTIHITARRHNYTPANNFFFSPSTTDSLLLIAYDSSGRMLNRYPKDEDPYIQYPFQFFEDSIGRTWFARVSQTDLFANNYPNSAYSVGGKWTPRPYSLIKPTTYFPYSKDTILLFKEPTGTVRASVLKTWQGYLPVANAKYWYLPGIRWFNSVAREDKENYYAMAKDSSLKDMIFKFRVQDSSIVWAKKFDSTIVTIKGDAVNGSLYTMSTQGDAVFIRKFNGTTGELLWSKTIDPLPGHIVKPGDFAISKQRLKITVVGYQVDTMIRDMSKAQITVFDTAGAEMKSEIMHGYKGWQNKATSIHIGQDGQTLVAGQVTDAEYGYAGFIFYVDSSSLRNPAAAPQLASIIPPVCSSAIMQTAKLLNPAKSPYTITIVQDSTLPLTYNSSDSSFQYPVSIAGNHTIRISYSYMSSEVFTQVSYSVKALPAGGAAPTQSGNLLTAPASGNMYQWYFNGTAITGATTSYITALQSGLYNYTYTVDGCMSPQSASLNYIVSGITDPTNNNAVISISPNPTKGLLVISNLGDGYKYGIKLYDMNGYQTMPMTLLTQGSTARLELQRLSAGSYILEIWNMTKKRIVGKQVILLAR
jgi:hypothetical protein